MPMPLRRPGARRGRVIQDLLRLSIARRSTADRDWDAMRPDLWSRCCFVCRPRSVSAGARPAGPRGDGSQGPSKHPSPLALISTRTPDTQTLPFMWARQSHKLPDPARGASGGRSVGGGTGTRPRPIRCMVAARSSALINLPLAPGPSRWPLDPGNGNGGGGLPPSGCLNPGSRSRASRATATTPCLAGQPSACKDMVGAAEQVRRGSGIIAEALDCAQPTCPRRIVAPLYPLHAEPGAPVAALRRRHGAARGRGFAPAVSCAPTPRDGIGGPLQHDGGPIIGEKGGFACAAWPGAGAHGGA